LIIISCERIIENNEINIHEEFIIIHAEIRNENNTTNIFEKTIIILGMFIIIYDEII